MTRLYVARVTAGSSELELLCFDMSGNLLNTKYITLEEPVIAAYQPIRSRTLYVSDDESLFLFYAQDLHSSDKTYAYILKDANQYFYLLENYMTMLYDEFCLVDDVIFRTHYDESKITATYTVDGETWFNLGEETSGYYSITTNTFATYSEELEKYFYLNARWTGLEGQIFSGYLNCNSTYDFFPISGVDCSIPDISLYNTYFAPKELICRDGKVYAYVQYFFNSLSGGGIFATDGISTNLITAGSGHTFDGKPTFYFDTFSLYVNTNGNISAIGKDKNDSPSGFWSWEVVNDELVRTEQLDSLVYRRLSYSKTGYAKEGNNYYFVEVDFTHVWSLHTPTSTITLPTGTDQYYVGAYFINDESTPVVPAFWTEKVKCVETIYEYGT